LGDTAAWWLNWQCDNRKGCIITINTADAVSFESSGNALRTAMKRCGATTAVDALAGAARYAYALIGIADVGEGNGIEQAKGSAATETGCDISTLLINETVVGINAGVTSLSRLNATHIADGAIITSKISAGAITADKIAANSITAEKLVAGSITGEKIAANQTISAPVISGGTLNLGSGNFVVDSGGNVTSKGAFTIAKNGTGVGGVKLTQDRLDVYDESGVLRVRVGLL
jgi:hypothetical protein